MKEKVASGSRKQNRLAQETSPYLLQHAENPVDWYAWGPEALARARAEDRPIFLSIGYAACHWCHVMEKESFEDEETAAMLSREFVCIKVDREERPDIDEIYMSATVAMTGGGGWPMTVFLTPDLEPFFAGTYFPPTSRYGKPSFKTVIARLSEAWKDERAEVVGQAKLLTDAIQKHTSRGEAAAIASEAFDSFLRGVERTYDQRFGGFGSAPKFPPCETLRLLLRLHQKTGNARALEMVRGTLDGMKDGGMYDQVGGGFARYSTDQEWHVPHFEKMLYDNAGLARVYTEAFQVTGDLEYKRIATETLDYVIREMTGDHGGYFSATDADSEGEEGKFFVFSVAEVETLLGQDKAALFCAFYDISEGGNWEGNNVLRRLRSLEQVLKEEDTNLSVDEARAWLEESREKVYRARQKRVPPLLDDKVLTAWNGLMIGSMAFAARVFDEPRYLASAERATAMIESTLTRPDAGLLRTFRAGKAHLDAYLEDYAYLADALVDLYESSGEERFLRRAETLCRRIIVDFGQEGSAALCLTARDHEKLLVRTSDGADGAIPNANAVAARALVRVGAHLGDGDLSARGGEAIEAHGQFIAKVPRAFATSLSLADFLSEPPIEIVVVGDPGAAATRALERTVAKSYLPNAIFARAAAPSPSKLPLLEGKRTDVPACFICENFACASPIHDPSELGAALLAVTLERAQRSAR